LGHKLKRKSASCETAGASSFASLYRCGPKLSEARQSAAASIKALADHRAANVLPLIREIQCAGATSLHQIADAHNARGISTPRGGRWYAKSVSNVLSRA
jgi:hypothetical protein